MIFGVGTDLIRVARIQAVLEAHPHRFARRLLHPEELESFRHSQRPANFLAKAAMHLEVKTTENTRGQTWDQ